MTAIDLPRPNPYVGPRSFQTGETLYGRDREVQDLLGLLIAERIVLLHSPSGAGKTSLVQAALIPQLEAREFEVLPIVRVSLELPLGADLSGPSAEAAPNRYVLSVLLSLEEALPEEQQTPLSELAGISLADYLNRRSAASAGASEVLIFDQFEEILTLDPANQATKAAFFVQLGAALRNRQRWALFSMREDYVASLSPYLRPIPTRLANTFRLDLLSAGGARLAIQQPARRLGVEFDDTAAARLVDDLRRVYIQRPDGSTEEQLGPALEPVQLQVVCYRMWGQLPADAQRIGVDDIGAVGDVNTALADYYAERVATIAAATGVGEREIRMWFDRQLIMPQGIRGQVLQSAERSQGLDNRAIWALVDAYLVRAEKRRGATWFELAHDRLIDPVRANNAAWIEANLSPLQRQADLWEHQDRPAGMLLREQALAEAEIWAAAHAGELTATEHDFLDLSIQARAQAARERRNNLIIRGLFGVALVVMAIAIFFFFRAQAETVRANSAAANAIAQQQTAEAEASRADREANNARTQEQKAVQEADRANREADNALRQSQIALARALVTPAFKNLTIDPEQSVLLAMQAISVTAAVSEPVLPEVQETLQQAVQASRIERLLAGQGGSFNSIAYSHDGKRLAVAGQAGAIELWDAATGQPIDTFGVSKQEILAVGFSPDDALLAIASKDATASVLDSASGEILLTLTGHQGEVNGVAFSPEGNLLATASEDQTAKLWDVATGKELRTFNEDAPVLSVAFSPDGESLATANADGKATLWNTATGQVLRTFEGHAEYISSVAFSPDGSTIATAGGDHTAILWDTATGEQLRMLTGHASSIYAVTFSSDGEYVATASADGTAKIWSTSSGKQLITLAGHRDWVKSVAFSPNDAHIATASLDETVRVWSLALVPADGTYFVAFSPDGTRLASAADAGARIWDAATGQRLQLIPAEGFSGAVFSPDGKQLATSGYDGTASLWDAADGTNVQTFEGHSGAVGRIVFNSDGTRLATAGDDQTARVWDVATGKELAKFEGFTNQIYGVAFSPDGARLAAGDQDGVAKIWEIATGKLLLTLPKASAGITSVAFSPDGKFLAASSDNGTAIVWDAATGGERYAVRHTAAVNYVTFSPDGARLATASNDKSVKVWDATSGKLLFTLPQPAEIYAAAFSPDGARLATAGADGIARIYPLKFEDLLALAKQRVTRRLTPEECQSYGIERGCG